MIVGRGGGTFEKISVPSTLTEILLFSALYGLAGLLQIGIVLFVAALLGRLAGLAFIAVATVLNFEPRLQVAVNPLTFGIALVQKHEQHEYVKRAQFLLFVVGLGALVLALSGYFPALWEWRITWSDGQYVILSRWFGGEWYIAPSIEVIGRALGILVMPMIGWPTLTLISWASRMEVTRPKFREAMVAQSTPETEAGPFGEEYRERRASPAPQPKPPAQPEKYIPLVEE